MTCNAIFRKTHNIKEKLLSFYRYTVWEIACTKTDLTECEKQKKLNCLCRKEFSTQMRMILSTTKELRKLNKSTRNAFLRHLLFEISPDEIQEIYDWIILSPYEHSSISVSSYFVARFLVLCKLTNRVS